MTAIIMSIGMGTHMAFADRNNNAHDGNNGQCRKLQSTFPPELQDYQGCHDSFSGQEHNDHDNNGDDNNGIGHGNGEENGNGHNKDDDGGGGGEEPPSEPS